MKCSRIDDLGEMAEFPRRKKSMRMYMNRNTYCDFFYNK